MTSLATNPRGFPGDSPQSSTPPPPRWRAAPTPPTSTRALPPPTTSTPRRVSLSSVAILLFIALNLGLCLRRVRDDRAAVAFVAFSHINLLLLFGALRRFEVSPHGSPARGRARLAVWLLTATLTAAFTCKIGAMLPLGFAVAAWVMAAATVIGGFYIMFLHGDK